MGSFRRGLQTLPQAMAAKLEGVIRTGWVLEGIRKEGKWWVVMVGDGGAAAHHSLWVHAWG